MSNFVTPCEGLCPKLYNFISDENICHACAELINGECPMSCPEGLLTDSLLNICIVCEADKWVFMFLKFYLFKLIIKNALIKIKTYRYI